MVNGKIEDEGPKGREGRRDFGKRTEVKSNKYIGHKHMTQTSYK